MNNYLILFIGMVLGQMSSTAVIVYIAQKKKDIAYWPAMRAYVISEQGGYIIAALMLLVTMFLVSDYIEPVKTAGDTTRTWLQKVQLAKNFKLYAYIFGVFAPIIAIVAFKKGFNAIKKEDAKLSVG